MPKFNITTPSGQKVQVDAATPFDAMNSLLGQTGPDVSQLGSFGRGALSMLPLGDQAYAGVASLGQNEPYTQERQELSKEQAQDKEVNPLATYAGKAAGIAAPIALTGGLAAPESLAGALGQGALVGGAYGAGNAVDTLASGGSGAKAAGDVALGAGLGLAGGAAGEGLSALVGKAGDAVADSTIGERLHAENISKALGLNPRSLVKLSKSGDATPEQAILKTWEDLKNVGLPDDFVAPTSNINDKYGALEAINNDAGNVIGAQRQASGQATAGNFPEGMQAARDLANASKDYVGIPDGSQEAMQGIAAQLQAAESAGKLDFEQLARIRSAVGNQVQRDVPGSHQIYKILSQKLDDAGERIGNAPGIDKAAYQKAMKTYAVTSKVLPLMQRGAAREASGTGGGLSNLLGIGGTLMGHPAAAAAPAAHEIQKLAAPEMIHNLMLGASEGSAPAAIAGALPLAGAAVAAKQAPEAAAITDIHLNHPAMAPWRQTFTQNAAKAKNPGEVAKANAVTDFTLSQRDPAYAKAKQTASENPEASGASPTNMASGGVVLPAEDTETTFDQDKNYGPAETKPPEQKLLDAMNSVAAGYGTGAMGSGAAMKGAQVASDLGEAGAVFPDPADLPPVQSGATTGEPHALFAYKDNYGPGGAERNIYNVFGDKANPAIKKVGWGSSVSEAALKENGIPITGKQAKRFANGGAVTDDRVANGNPAFGSTLPGLQGIADKIAATEESTAPVRSTAPPQFHQSFNPQFEEQLKAYLMRPKGDNDAK